MQEQDPASEASRTKDSLIARYEDQIAPILFHAVRDGFHVEPMYIRPPYPGAMAVPYSLNVEAEAFVAMSRRAVLCICGSETDDPAQYLLPVLLDLCEITRARWQALVILNKTLDDSIEDSRLTSSPRISRNARAAKIRQIAELGNRLASSENDPGTYVCSGDALQDIHERLLDVFMIKRLSAAVRRKLDALEQLYRHGLELTWTDYR